MDKMPDKHVLQKRSRKHDNKPHIETCCDFFIKYLYMKGNSKKHKVSFPGRFLPTMEVKNTWDISKKKALNSARDP